MKKFWIRIFCTVVIVLIILVVTLGCNDKSLAFLGNLWTAGALVASAIMTGLILAALIDNLKKIKEENAAKKVKMVQGFSCIFIALAFMSIILLILADSRAWEIKTWLFATLGLIASFLICLMDLSLAKLSSFRHLKEILIFDKGIFVGILLTIGIGLILNRVATGLSDGFVGGATAFQLIIANLAFDPRYYEPQEGIGQDVKN